MQHLKVAAVGAAIIWLGNQAAQQANSSATFASSPTLQQYFPYLVGGGVLVAAKHFNLV